MDSFECFACRKIVPFLDKKADKTKCPSCGSGNGQVISPERVKEGMDSGAFFNLGPDGKRAKKKRR